MVNKDIAVNVIAKDQNVAADTIRNTAYIELRADLLANFLVHECSDR